MFKPSHDKDTQPAKKPGGFMKRLSLVGKSASKECETIPHGSLESVTDGTHGDLSTAMPFEQEQPIQKKHSGMFRRLSFGSKKSSDKDLHSDQASNLEDNQSETGSRTGTVDDAPIKKRNSGFFKRLSIGSKKPSFDTDSRHGMEQGLGLDSRSDDSSLVLPPEPDIDFDPHTMLEHIRRTNSAEDGSDASSVSTAKQSKTKSSVGSLFKKKKRKSTNNISFSISEEFTRVRDNWHDRCSDAGCPLSGSMLSEFKKRIAQAGGANSKAKLNFTGMNLHDKQLILLVEELAYTPVLAKLELNNNLISTKGALVLRNLMACQLEMSTLLEPHQRANVTFLGDVVLMKSKLTIDSDLLIEIPMIADALAYRNVQNLIWSAYHDKAAPVPITTPLVSTLWEDLLGGTVNRSVLIVARARLSNDPHASAEVNAEWTYQEMEAVLVDGFVQKGLLSKHEAGQHGHAEALQQRIANRRPSLQSVDSQLSGSASPPSSSPYNPAVGRKQVNAVHDSMPAQESAGIAMSDASYSTKETLEEATERDDSDSPRTAPVKSDLNAPRNSIQASAPHSPVERPEDKLPSSTACSSNSLSADSSVVTGQAWSPSRRATGAAPAEGLKPPSVPAVKASVPEASLQSVRPSSSPFSARPTTEPSTVVEPARAEAAPSPPLFLEEPEGSDEEPFMLEEIEEQIDMEGPVDDQLQDTRTEATLSFRLSSPGSSSKSGVSYRSLSPQPLEALSPKQVTPQLSPKSVGSPVKHSNSSINNLSPATSPKPAAYPTFHPAKATSPKVSAQAIPFAAAVPNVASTVKSPAATQSVPLRTSSFKEPNSPKEVMTPEKKVESRSEAKVIEKESVSATQVQQSDLSDKAHQGQSPASPKSVSPKPTDTPAEPQAKAEKVPSPKPWSILQSFFAPSQKSPEKSVSAAVPAPTVASMATHATPAKATSAVGDTAFKEALNNTLSSRVPAPAPVTTKVIESASSANKKWPVVATSGPPGSMHASTAPARRDFSVPIVVSPNSKLAATSSSAPTHSFGTSPSRSPPTSARARSPQPSSSRAHSPPRKHASNSPVDQGRLTEDDLKFAIDLSADDIEADYPLTSTHRQNVSSLSETHNNTTADAPRVYVIPGITRRKFNANEFALLQKLPHCRIDAQHEHQQECSSESKTTSFYALPKKTADSLKLTPSSVLNGAPIAAGTCLDKSCAKLDDVGIVKVLNDTHSGTITAVILRGNKCVKLTSLRLSERFTHLISLDLSNNRLSGRIAVNVLPPTLVRLDLSHNELTDFSGVMSCMRLEELNLSYNKIETIHVLPKTLVRLNIEHNFIWSKMCLRLLALSPELRFVGLDGNPVLELVSGWSVFLRSISAKLEYVGKHQAKHSPKKSAVHAHSDRSLYLSTRSTALHMPQPIAPTSFSTTGISEMEQKRSLAEQRKRDQDRSELHHARLQEHAQKREHMLETARLSALVTVSAPKPEHEILHNVLHLTQPRHQSVKHPNSAKKKGLTKPPSFGTGRSSYGSFLATEVWESDQNTSNNGTKSSFQSEPLPKWSRGASLAALNNWIELASTGLEGAVVLIAQVDQELVQVPRAVTTDDIEIFQEHLQDLRLHECDPLPLKVKMALNAVVFEASMIDVVTQLHRRLKDYRTILRQLETALILSARDGSDFRHPFTIILSSPLGESLRKPATKSTLLSEAKRTFVEPESAPLSLNDQNAALRERLSRSITASSSAASASSAYIRPTDQFAEALTEKSMAPWLTLAAHNQAHSASVLAGLMELSTHLSQSTDNEAHRGKILTAALTQLRKDLAELNLSQYATLPDPVKVALSVQTRHTKNVEDSLRILRAFAKLFQEVENVLQLCATGGVDFEAALQGVMNSSYGRTVKRLVQGAPAMTIVAPRSRSSTPTQSPKDKSPKLGRWKSSSPSQTSRSPAQPQTFQHFFAEPEAPAAIIEKPISDTVNAPPTLSFAGRFYASVDATVPHSTLPAVQTSHAVPELPPAPITVDVPMHGDGSKIEPNDGNQMTIQRWVEASEEALGRASIVFNTLVDLAHSKAPPSDRDVAHLQEERSRLSLTSLEPPPLEVLAALHLLDKQDLILGRVQNLRSRLDEFDDLFARIENAMLMSVEDEHDFQYSFDVIMRTELGQKINREVYSIYDYQIYE